MGYNDGMTYFPVFISIRFILSILGFVEHWYIDSFHFALRKVFQMLGRMENTFALKVTLRNFFQPLYQDRSLLGFFMGIWWRTLRLALGFFAYAAFILAAIFVYFLWLVLPAFLIFKILEPWLLIRGI